MTRQELIDLLSRKSVTIPEINQAFAGRIASGESLEEAAEALLKNLSQDEKTLHRLEQEWESYAASLHQ